jgi:hypothetical protein
MANDLVPYKGNMPMSKYQPEQQQIELTDQELQMIRASRAIQIGVHAGIQDFINDQERMRQEKSQYRVVWWSIMLGTWMIGIFAIIEYAIHNP